MCAPNVLYAGVLGQTPYYCESARHRYRPREVARGLAELVRTRDGVLLKRQVYWTPVMETYSD